MLGTAGDERLRELVQPLIDRDAAGALSGLANAIADGVDPGQLAEQIVGCLRDMMAAHVGCPAELLLYHSPDELPGLRERAEAWGMQTLLAAVQIVDQAIARMRQSVHSRVLLELALVRVAQLDQLDDLSHLIQRLDGGQALDQPPPVKKKGNRWPKKRLVGVRHSLIQRRGDQLPEPGPAQRIKDPYKT